MAESMETTEITITAEDFWKADIRIGTVESAESVTGSEKLLKLSVDLGSAGKRQILTGMAKWYKPEELVGLKTAFLLNIPIRKMVGLESQGMILGTDTEENGRPVFLTPREDVPNGSKVI
jgi:methionine--tRNA ligase beta chain